MLTAFVFSRRPALSSHIRNKSSRETHRPRCSAHNVLAFHDHGLIATARRSANDNLSS